MLSHVSSAVIDERPGDPGNVGDTMIPHSEARPRTRGTVMDEDDQPARALGALRSAG